MHWGVLLPEGSEMSLRLPSSKFLVVLNSISGLRTLGLVASLIHIDLTSCPCAASAFHMAST